MKNIKISLALLLIFVMIAFFSQAKVSAHCDTLDGPLIKEARLALDKGDVTPVLKWVKKEHEAEVRAAFDKALAERSKNPEAKERINMEFFEILVRIHRESEGATFIGLKPAGTDLGPAVAGADKALENGSVDEIVTLITEDVASGIRQRFTHALEKKTHKDESVEAGREFIEAYVEFVHYVERIHQDTKGQVGHHE